MSVVKGERKKGTLDVIEASKNLVNYTYDRIKDNEIFPKSERWMMAYDTWRGAKFARSKIIRANSIRVENKTEAEARILLEKEALGHLDDLLDCIDILLMKGRISDSRAEFWTGLVLKTMTPLKGWIKSDKERYKQFG